MPKRTIANNFLVVIFSALVLANTACHRSVVEGGEPPAFDRDRSPFETAKIVGRVGSAEIRESSGIAASKCQEDVLWTHNDSGDGPFVFAMDKSGNDLGKWRVSGAENVDWEDIATFKDPSGKCFIYIGDTGNSNKDARAEHKIFRVAEPSISENVRAQSRREPLVTETAEVLAFAYPDERQDSETLLVHPSTGQIYVVTKDRKRPARVYGLSASFGGQLVKAQKISDLTVPAIPNGFLTGGDITSDGRRIVICDYFAAYEFSLPSGNSDFNEIWKQKPAVVDLGERKQGEAIGYSADGLSVFATSEGKNQPLLEAKRRQ